ncbi:MAG: hypothetical protein ABIN61_08580 [candidate division WOR-3 bacterium]
MFNRATSKFIFLLSKKKMDSKKMEFPLKNIKRVALRPSEEEGETFYSLPIAETLRKKFELSLILPEDKDVKYFKNMNLDIITYRSKLGLIGVLRLKKRIKKQYDLLIDFNKDGIPIFSFVLKRPFVISMYDVPGVNIVGRAKDREIIRSYQFLMRLIGFPSISWQIKGVKGLRKKEEVVGITSDIGVEYHGLYVVNNYEDLKKVSKIISRKNDLSTFAFFLKIPQVLLLEEDDPFEPPSSIKVVRYSKRITSKIIGDCLMLLE